MSTVVNRFGRFAVIILLAFTYVGAQAGGKAADQRFESLTAGHVLESSYSHFPGILESLAERRAAKGAVLEANGAFDLVFAAEGGSRVAGFYDGSYASGGIRQGLGPLGSNLYIDYKLSDGTFPVYEDINATNDRGELSVGVLFSLLRDRRIDSRRFDIGDSQLALRAAGFDLLLTRIGVQQRALIAYWRWVISGYELSVYEDLLQIALDRETGLEKQVSSGARAEIFLTENGLNITNRRRLATAAVQSFQAATNNLSLFYRDADGRSLMAPREALPPSLEDRVAESQVMDDAPSISAALTRRPELEILRTAIERARNRVILAENELLPRVDLSIGLSNDFGSVADSAISRDSLDAVVGVTFSVPLQQRGARGRVIRQQAAVDALVQRQQLQRDQIEVEVQNILLSLQIAEDLMRLAELEMQQAEAMADAERRRFESGASDFFLVNIREETAANAVVRYFEADLARRIARINYEATTVNLESFGISADAL